MEHGVRRAVETAIKREEIEKAREAVSDRKERAMWNSRPPVGLEFDDAHEYLVASEQFDAVVDALEMLSAGVSYRSIVDETGLSRGAIGRWIENVQYRARSCRDSDTARKLLRAAPDDAIGDTEGDGTTTTSGGETV